MRRIGRWRGRRKLKAERGKLKGQRFINVSVHGFSVQRSEVRGQRSEIRGQRSEGRRQKAEGRGQGAEVRGQRAHPLVGGTIKIPPNPPGPDPGPDRVFHSVAFSIFCRARAGRVFLSEALSNFCRAPGPDRDDTNDTSVQGCRARAGRAGPLKKGGNHLNGEP